MKEIFKKLLPKNNTGTISLLAFSLSVILSILYYFFDQNSPIFLLIFISGLLFLVPYLRGSKHNSFIYSLYLCYTIPISAISISLINKPINAASGLVDPTNFFDIRFVLISCVLVPITTIPIKKKKELVIGILPSFLTLILFDPLHNYFGVGYFQLGNESNDYYFSANIFSLISFAFMATSFLIIKNKLEKSLNLLQQKNNNLQVYVKDLVRIGGSQPVLSGDFCQSCNDIVHTIQRSMGLSRVSIWDFDDNYESLSCKALLDSGELSFDNDILMKNNHGDYFEHILNKKIILADEVYKNEATKEFASTYLAPNDITSLMNVVYVKEGKIAGIISCEMQHIQRNWTLEDTIYIKAMSDILSFLHANKKQITRNQELENRVKERTSELQEKNEQLQEYAYINSHILRAPVARIYGLYHLIETEYHDSLNEELMSHFKVSVVELDQITRKINKAIDNLGTFDRRYMTDN